MITGAREYAEHDAAAKDRKDLRIDESILQDAIDKKQVDEAARRHAERELAAASHSAAQGLAHARLIQHAQVKDVAGLIEKTWLESPS